MFPVAAIYYGLNSRATNAVFLAQHSITIALRSMARANRPHFIFRQLTVPLTDTPCNPVRHSPRPMVVAPLVTTFSHHISLIVGIATCKQMIGATTGRIVAGMAHKGLAFWQAAIVKFPRNAVSKYTFSCRPASKTEQAIAALEMVASPNPAGTKFRAMFGDWAILVNLRPKTLCEGAFSAGSKIASKTAIVARTLLGTPDLLAGSAANAGLENESIIGDVPTCGRIALHGEPPIRCAAPRGANTLPRLCSAYYSRNGVTEDWK